MKPSKILRKAAALIEHHLHDNSVTFAGEPVSHWGACEIIEQIEGCTWEDMDVALTKFQDLFQQDGSCFWFGRPADIYRDEEDFMYKYDKPNVANQQHRIFALLFTAEILESEGK